MRVVHLSTIHTALDVRIFYKECRTLAADGHSVHLLALDPPERSRDGVHFHGFQPPVTTFRPGRIGKRLAEVYRRAAALKADVYHFHDPELIIVGTLLKRTGAKVVYDVHENAPQEALTLNKSRPLEARCKSIAWSALEAMAMRTLNAFVCATPSIARRFPARRTITVQNFPRLEEFPSPERDEVTSHARRPPQVAYVGAIANFRGSHEMVRAMGTLPDDSAARLVLAGMFASPDLRIAVERLPGWQRVDYVNVQPRHGVHKILARSRVGLVLFHPERDHLNAQPNKLFEYMAAGIPVVASDFPLWREFVSRTGCGLTVDPLDPRAIGQAIRYLLDNPDVGEAMGRRGQAAVRGGYNWEAESAKLLNLYQELAAS